MNYLYHTGFEIVEQPDISVGRKNADFGQGFYLSDDREFSRRWARERKGLPTYLNSYTFEPDGLRIKHLSRDPEWFDYIFANRSGQPDSLSGYDVIIGPIANDTIYDTWGIPTSGLLRKDQALELLSAGPVYEQTVIKTEKGLAALHYQEAILLSPEEIQNFRETVRREEEQFQEELSKRLDRIMNSSN